MPVKQRIVKTPAVLFALSLLLLIATVRKSAAIERGAKGTTLAELREQRAKATRRERRIIFNNDGCDLTHFCKEATAGALLALRTKPLVGTHVDTIFYNTSGSFGRFRHRTTVGEVFSCKAEGFANNKTQEFINQGTDALEIMVQFCHENRIECFWSMRMNDIHDSYKGWYAPYLFPQLKKDHPQWLMGSRENPPPVGRMWSAVDYGQQEIRDLAYSFHEEVCQNYDVDGIELDFFRQLTYFRRPATAQDANQEDRDKMTGLLRRIREMTQRVGFRRGRPILVAVRIPDSVGYCRAIGLDVDRWLTEGLIDLLVASGDFRLSPWETTVRLGHQHGVPVYACLSNAAMRDGEARKVRSSLACWRGRAADAWHSGVDGIYIFNVFNPKYRLWRELGDREALTRADRAHCSSARGGKQVNRFLATGDRFLDRSVVAPDNPRELRPGKPMSIDLEVSCPLQGKESPLPKVNLALRVEPLVDLQDVSVTFNNKPLSGGASSNVWIEYPLCPDAIRRGVNRADVLLNTTAPAAVHLHDLVLWVRYANGP